MRLVIDITMDDELDEDDLEALIDNIVDQVPHGAVAYRYEDDDDEEMDY